MELIGLDTGWGGSGWQKLRELGSGFRENSEKMESKGENGKDMGRE